MKKTILYLMHVDWNWIKQRPHFMAEHLNEYFDVRVIHKAARSKKTLASHTSDLQHVSPLPNIPLQRFKLVRRINTFLRKMAVRRSISRSAPDFIWITHPDMLELLPAKTESKIIYDCMDDALGFADASGIRAKHLLEQERILIRRASRVFVSSNHLAEVIDQRESCADKSVLIRNAYDGRVVRLDPQERVEMPAQVFVAGYFGTISEWFEFASLLFCLERIPNLRVQLVGPIHKVTPPAHERIDYVGPVDHAELENYVRHWHCLIMPFLVTDLISSVDPVKLYEYINFSKPILSVWYKELERFAPFASFYTDEMEMLERITEIMHNPTPKYTDGIRMQFLQENTWAQRAHIVQQELHRLSTERQV